MSAIIFPQVNLNGTSAEALLRQYTQAADAIRVAVNAFVDAAPHGRDYQTLPDGAYERARAEHRQHLIHLDAALAYAEAVANSIINPEETRR